MLIAGPISECPVIRPNTLRKTRSHFRPASHATYQATPPGAAKAVTGRDVSLRELHAGTREPGRGVTCTRRLLVHVDRFRIANDRTVKKGMPPELCCIHEKVDLRSV
jgi:hypothetical protein